jgi:iron-sulfur cluster assembly accessory protein
MIQLSDSAIAEINRLRRCHSNPQAFFRLRVAAGGCLELLYLTQFDDQPQPTDQTYECGGIPIVIDTASLTHVEGIAIDYSEDLMGGNFRFHNPHSSKTCGCGISFSTTER